MTNKKQIIIISSCAFFVLLFAIACTFSQGFTQGGTIDYLITLIASFCLFFWGMTMVYRVQYKKQRTILLVIFVISFLWIALRFVKWLANIHFVSVYADYFYYVPMTIIPLLLFILVVETFCPKLKHKKIVYGILIGIISLFIILAFTNDLHHLIYKNFQSFYPEDNPGIDIITYDYNFLHFVMLGFISLLNISTIALFFWWTYKQISFNQIIISSLLVIFLFAYIVLYTLNVEIIKNTLLLKDFALVIVVLVCAILETLLDVGLIQNNGKYAENFKKSNLPMCIYNENKQAIFVSEKFSATPHKNLKEKTKEIGTYTLVVQEDLTEIVNLKEKISEETKELENINQMLEKLIKVNSEQSKLSHKLEFASEIEASIESTKKELQNLILSLPDKITKDNEKAVKQNLGIIALYLGYMKQKCMLLLSSKERQNLTYDAFKLIMQVISKDMQSVGFNDIAFNITKTDEISFDFALKVNDFAFFVAKSYGFCDLDTIIFANPNGNTCTMELAGKNIQIKEIKIDGLKITCTKEDDYVRISMGVQNG